MPKHLGEVIKNVLFFNNVKGQYIFLQHEDNNNTHIIREWTKIKLVKQTKSYRCSKEIIHSQIQPRCTVPSHAVAAIHLFAPDLS